MDERKELMKESYEIRQWFQDNDWKVNKRYLGEWTEDDPRWVQYLADREVKRARLDIINYILGGE
ncbi:MAG TPA: hypothetical protein PLE59_01015 [Bacteroidales bacterium]|jgi:hypothetical protein|nr:MAG: hypothetical protein BWX59_01317 [Bacteroidetes bacterium ADurb.Bin028]HNZ77230.1 hypothetical protein [Bacilli bacterium]HOE15190.1 hypothetical protein [Candidatus Paceibacterota bacterium]HPL02078.1 hypothetical protein [Bacteroidales bacterium]HQL11797.1 hypothetical protein [bacterium]